jgi:hypothetical protein
VPLILDDRNVFEYLAKLNLCEVADRDRSYIRLISAKNFNLLINLPTDRYLLVKQEMHDIHGKTLGEFHAAWKMRELVDRFPSLGVKIKPALQEILHFDAVNSILVVKFLDCAHELSAYYKEKRNFSPVITKSIGQLLGTIHGDTYQQLEYRQFVTDLPYTEEPEAAINIIQRMERVEPKVFGTMPPECLQFYKLYRRFPVLPQAIVELGRSITPGCVVHNDLKLNNILLDREWENSAPNLTYLIDWERIDWGDPAYDLGCLIGSYLEIWLEGLVINSALSINESLQLATTPLEVLQPSLFTLIESYFNTFPTILNDRLDFLDRVIQYAGLSLIKRIEITIEGYRSFGNQGIIMLQVAKQLLCSPQAARNTLFGGDAAKLSA